MKKQQSITKGLKFHNKTILSQTLKVMNTQNVGDALYSKVCIFCSTKS